MYYLSPIADRRADPQKRAAFDRYGSDPESRFGGVSSGPRSAASPFGGATFDGEMSPEELFNMFFSSGPGFGGPFGGTGASCHFYAFIGIIHVFFI
jgi:DnaJ family protein B protein 12